MMSHLMGLPAPTFREKAVIGGEMTDLDSEELKGRYVVVFFYPADFSFLCITELLAFESRYDEFVIIDCEFVACSCDSDMAHLSWTQQPRELGGLGPVRFPLVADPSGSIARDFGVFISASGFPARATFVIDEEGIVRFASAVDFVVGRNVTETLRIVKALKFTDRFKPEVRLQWRPSNLEGFVKRGGGGGEGGGGFDGESEEKGEKKKKSKGESVEEIKEEIMTEESERRTQEGEVEEGERKEEEVEEEEKKEEETETETEGREESSGSGVKGGTEEVEEETEEEDF